MIKVLCDDCGNQMEYLGNNDGNLSSRTFVLRPIDKSKLCINICFCADFNWNTGDYCTACVKTRIRHWLEEQ